ncbi:MAG: hypothetical protein AAB526_00030, partial [Patescibacteria group bacterium]
MQKIIFKKIFFNFYFIFSAFFIVFLISPVMAWEGPLKSPPEGNELKIITTDTKKQIKTGALEVSTEGNGDDKGLIVGSNTLILADGQNLIYGNIDSTSAGNLLLLQNEGVEKFKVDKDGNVTVNNLCFGKTDCKSSWQTQGNEYWTESGNNIYSNNTGNIGIGTTDPGSALHIEKSSNNLQVYIYNPKNAAGYHGLKVKTINTNAATLPFYVEAGANRLLTVQANGKVGIGTSTPGAELDVNGNVRASIYYDKDEEQYYIDPAAN